MVKPFHFSRLPDIHFKNGVLAELPVIISRYGKRIALICGKNSFLGTPAAAKLFHDLEEKDIIYKVKVIEGEPSPEIVDDAVKNFQNQKINLVVAIGGGSAIDAGKAISAMMFTSDSVLEYLEVVGTKVHPGTKLPFIAIPTTSGTGSEATKNAVISRIGTDGFKRSLRHDNFIPDIALIDPELTYNCPKEITAASGMDCFTQLTESYLSDKSNLYTDALALEGLKIIHSSLKRSYLDGSDKEARSGMSFAALTSGICLANAGLGAVHGFASSIGGMFRIAHGMICGTLMAKTNEINVRELRKTGKNPGALKKYANLGELYLGNIRKSDDYYIDGFIDYLVHLSQDLNLTSLNIQGFRENDIKIISMKTEIKNNPVPLTIADLQEILTSSIK